VIAIITVGLPASGKTSYAESLPAFLNINRDEIRVEVTGKRDDHSQERVVQQYAHEQIAKAAREGKGIIISDTNLNRLHRKQLVKHLQEMGYDVEAHLFNVGPKTCVERNSSRSHPVPANTIYSMAKALQEHPPSYDEGYTQMVMLEQEGAMPLFSRSRFS